MGGDWGGFRQVEIYGLYKVIVDFLVLCFVQVFFLLVLKDGNMIFVLGYYDVVCLFIDEEQCFINVMVDMWNDEVQ